MQPNKRKIRLITILVPLLLIIIGVGVWFYLYSAKLSVEAVPSDSSLTINGEKRGQGTYRVRTGVYKIEASKQGFATESRSVLIGRGEKRYVGIALIPNSSTTTNWYASHPSDAKLLEKISSKNFDQLSADQIKKFPLIKNLPLIDRLFRIDYGPSKANPNNPTAIAFYVKYYSENGKQQAIEWLKFKGYDPNKLEVIYTNAATSQ